MRTEGLADSRLDAEDALRSGGAQIDDAVALSRPI